MESDGAEVPVTKTKYNWFSDNQLRNYLHQTKVSYCEGYISHVKQECTECKNKIIVSQLS